MVEEALERDERVRVLEGVLELVVAPHERERLGRRPLERQMLDAHSFVLRAFVLCFTFLLLLLYLNTVLISHMAI